MSRACAVVLWILTGCVVPRPEYAEHRFDIAKISAASDLHVLTAVGEVYRFPFGENYQFLSPERVHLPRRVVDLQSSMGSTCALDEDGSVYCWAYEGTRCGDFSSECNWHMSDSVPLRPVRMLGNVVEMAAGQPFCARTADEELYCWAWPFYWDPVVGAGVSGGSRCVPRVDLRGVVAIRGEGVEIRPEMVDGSRLCLTVRGFAACPEWPHGFEFVVRQEDVVCGIDFGRDVPRAQCLLRESESGAWSEYDGVDLADVRGMPPVGVEDRRMVVWNQGRTGGFVSVHSPARLLGSLDESFDVIRGVAVQQTAYVGNLRCTLSRTGELQCWDTFVDSDAAGAAVIRTPVTLPWPPTEAASGPSDAASLHGVQDTPRDAQQGPCMK